MEHVALTVLGLSLCLAISVAMLPIAKNVGFPYTVLLALLGVGIGLAALLFGDGFGYGIVGDFFGSLKQFHLSSEAILFIFLPVLIFESSLAIDVRRLLDDLRPILLLAVIGLLISTFAVGYTLFAVSEAALILCLLLGAIVSATDPVAVVAIFKDLGAPKRLAILVEGESLFNDATAIVLFSILAAMLAGTSDANFLSGTLSFFKVFIGGIVVGYVLARLVCYFISKIRNLALVEITLTVCLAYLSFVIAEHYFHVSGVMAVVTASLVLGSVGRTAISPQAWHALTETWEQLGFWANSLIFVLVGLLVPTLLSDFRLEELFLIIILLVTAFAARAFILYVLLELLHKAGWAEKVSGGFKAVMLWGGLRGAVSLALALAVLENSAFNPEDKRFVGILVTAFVLFTLFVNATTIRWVLSVFGLDKLSAADLAIRNRAMGLSLERITDALKTAAPRQNLDPICLDNIVANYGEKRVSLLSEDAGTGTVGANEWVRIGLAALISQERKAYLTHLEHGYMAAPVARHLIGIADDLVDAVKADGLQGYRRMVDTCLGFDWRFRLAVWLHRVCGWQKWLALEIVDRFERLMASAAVLNELRETEIDHIESVVGATTAEQLRAELSARLAATQDALDALKMHYPVYAAALQEWHIGRIALRLEHSDYLEMHTHSVISSDVYKHLEDELEARSNALEALPPLDLGLKPADMVKKVPFFQTGTESTLTEIAAMLKPQLAYPGQDIITKGKTGDAMYFLANGAVQLDAGGRRVTLGSGDFFGEIALVADRPRTATVRATGFCELLVLYNRDFRALLERNPDLRKHIYEAAETRMQELEGTEVSGN